MASGMARAMPDYAEGIDDLGRKGPYSIEIRLRT